MKTSNLFYYGAIILAVLTLQSYEIYIHLHSNSSAQLADASGLNLQCNPEGSAKCYLNKANGHWLVGRPGNVSFSSIKHTAEAQWSYKGKNYGDTYFMSYKAGSVNLLPERLDISISPVITGYSERPPYDDPVIISAIDRGPKKVKLNMCNRYAYFDYRWDAWSDIHKKADITPGWTCIELRDAPAFPWRENSTAVGAIRVFHIETTLTIREQGGEVAESFQPTDEGYISSEAVADAYLVDLDGPSLNPDLQNIGNVTLNAH